MMLHRMDLLCKSCKNIIKIKGKIMMDDNEPHLCEFCNKEKVTLLVAEGAFCSHRCCISHAIKKASNSKHELHQRESVYERNDDLEND